MLKKRLFLTIAWFVLLFTLFLVSCQGAPSRQMTALVVGGQAEILKSGESDWQVLEHRTLIHVGDSIRSGEDTWVYLEIDDGSLVGITPNTEATLVTFSKTARNPVTQFDLADGLIYVRVTKELGSGSFKVRTPVLTGSVVGSKMSVQYIDELDTAHVTCFEGEVNAEISYDVEEGMTDCHMIPGVKLSASSDDKWTVTKCKHPVSVQRLETKAYSRWEEMYLEIEWMRQTEAAKFATLTRIALTKTATRTPTVTETPEPTATIFYTPTSTPAHMTPRPTLSVEANAPLSDVEAANAGTHDYSFTATFTEGCNGETSGSYTLTIEFAGNTASLSNAGNRSQFFKVADSTYEAVDPFGEAVVMEFTSSGIHVYSYCADWVYTRK